MYFYITYCVFVKKPKSSCNIRRQTFPVNPSRVCCFWFFKNWMVCFESALQWKNNQTFPVIYCVFDPHWVTTMRRRASPTPPPGQTVLSMIHINISWLTFKGTKLLLPVSCWQSDMCLSLGGGDASRLSLHQSQSVRPTSPKSFLTISVSELSVVK